MYTPTHFLQDNPEELFRFMQAYSFATLVSGYQEDLKATHLPFTIEKSETGKTKLIAHLARENNHWPDLEKAAEVLVIFQGPHGYISPAHYESKVNVPTWNYTAVHAYGKAVVKQTAEDNREALEKLIAGTDPSYLSQMDALPAHYLQKLLTQIVSLEIAVSRLEGKYKLSQNRTAKEQATIISYFEQNSDPQQTELASMMREAGNIG